MKDFFGCLFTTVLFAVVVLAIMGTTRLPDDVSADTLAYKPNVSWTQKTVAGFGADWLDWQVTDYVIFKTATYGDTTLVADPITGKWHSCR